MTQYRHLYWDSGGQDLRMFADGGGASGTTLEVLSYYLRKRYAYLLDTGGTTIPGTMGNDGGKTQPDSTWYQIGGATNTHRIMGQHTEPNDNIPLDDPTYDALHEPDTDFTSDQTTTAQEVTLYYQNKLAEVPGIDPPDSATINNTGILYWSDPDLKIGPISETDLQDTLADHCLTQMVSGDEVGTYRVATTAPSGGTWSDKGQFIDDTIYLSSGEPGLEEGDYHVTGWDTPGHNNYQQTTQGDYRLWLKTANTTEPTTPDNYIRWDDTNNEIQLESSTNYSATSKLINDVYLNIIYRRHPKYAVSTVTYENYTIRGTIYDYIHTHGNYDVVLSGPTGSAGEFWYQDGVYTRTYEPTGTIVNNTGPAYFAIIGLTTPTDP